MKDYKAFEFNVKDLKKLLRNKKGLESPCEFTIILNGEKTKFTLFENDILDDNYMEYQDGKLVKRKGEINTYAGYLNDHPKNALRLYINDERISGFFLKDDISFDIGHITDYGINEKIKNINKSQIYIAISKDIFSNLGNSFCGVESINKSAKKAAVTSIPNCPNTPVCKFVRVAIETDNEFANNFWKPVGSGFSSTSNVNNVIIDMVNRADLAYFNSLGIRLKLILSSTYPFTPDPYTATGAQVYSEFINSDFVTGNTAFKDVSHLITGRPLDGLGITSNVPFTYGQANQATLCNAGAAASISTISCYLNCKNTTTNFLNYSDAYLTMAHEIAHVLGADHDNSGNATIMRSGEGKTGVFTNDNLIEIKNYYCNRTCLDNNIVNSTFTNRLKLTLNGNQINSTPVFINRNQKVVAIPPDINPLINLTPGTTSFSYSPSVGILYSNNTSTSFIMNSPVNNFTLNIAAQDKCLYYYWGVPFVYSASGARTASFYPIPTNNSLAIEPDENTLFELSEVQALKIIGENNIEESIDFNIDGKSIIVNTTTLKEGVKYVKLFLNNGEIITKRIIVNHE
jgi:Metallo-peptidase family M12